MPLYGQTFHPYSTIIYKKLSANLLNNRKKSKLFLVYYTIQWLKVLVHYLNVKINWKYVEKINAKPFSALKWEHV